MAFFAMARGILQKSNSVPSVLQSNGTITYTAIKIVYLLVHICMESLNISLMLLIYIYVRYIYHRPITIYVYCI